MTKRLLCCFLFIYFYLFYCFSCSAQWHQHKFVIGTFIDPIPSHADFYDDSLYYDQQIRMVKDAHFNLLSGYTYYSNNSFQFLKFKLGILKNYDISTMHHIISGYTNDNIITTIDSVKKIPADLRKWFEGYFLFDEPHPENLYSVRYMITRVKLYDRTKLAYVNLFPVYRFASKGQYEKYLDSFLVQHEPYSADVVSYDFYPFLGNRIRDGYYYNLSILKNKSAGRPLWFYPLTASREINNAPSLYQLSFMIFNPICYGAKGYIVFTYNTVLQSQKYKFEEAILSKDGLPTLEYDYISMINRFVSEIVGPVVMKSKLSGAYHVSNNPYHQSIPDSEYINENMPVLSRIGNENMVAGIFNDTTVPRNYYVLFTNKSPFSQPNVFITFKGDYENKIAVSPSYLAYQSGDAKFRPVKATYDPDANETRVFLDFNPGEGRLVRIKDVDDPFQQVHQPDHFNFSMIPNPLTTVGNIVFSLTKSATIRLSVYSIDGKLQQDIISPTHFLAGKYFETFIPRMHVAGTYLLILRVDNKAYTKKIIFLGH